MSSKSSFYNSTGVTNTQSNAIDASVDNAEASATASENSANIASTSASTATTKASEASTSAATATTKASEASTSASTATTKASEASTSAATATTKASESATSATASANSATSASTSASTATTKASEASSSASTALSHKNDAQTAKTAAETAETNAETAETNAASSSTAASTSASSASTSASTATTKANEAATSATSSANSATASANSATAAAASAASITGAETNAANSATAAASSATAAQTAKTAAETALDEFTDIYLGSKTSAPTLDNDGNALATGSIYWNSTTDQLYIWTGSAWDDAAFTASGAVTSFNTRSGAVTLSSADVTNAAGLLTTGGTMTGNLSFGDNDKAIFGAGSDLQIYSDGSYSYLQEGSGTSGIRITSDNQVAIRKHDNEDIAVFNIDGAVRFYHDNAQKFSTTSTGIDVTGTVTSDGLTVETSASDTGVDLVLDGNKTSNGGIGSIIFNNSGDSVGMIRSNRASANDAADLLFYTQATGGANTKRLNIANNGDISFYEDTGTTAKFFWDASAERLGLGTSSPNRQLSLKHASQADISLLSGSDTNGGLIYHNASEQKLLIANRESDGHISFQTGGTSERMRIDASGNVLVGKTSTSTTVAGIVLNDDGRLYATGEGGAGHQAARFTRLSNDGDIVTFYKDGSTVGSIGVQNFDQMYISTSDDMTIRAVSDITYQTTQTNASAGHHIFKSYNTEIMRIDGGNNNVGIGTSSPDELLHLSAGSGATIRLESTTTGAVAGDIFGAIEFETQDINSAGIKAKIDAYSEGAVGNASLRFFTGDTSSLDEAMRIDSSGRVGIGTSSPNTGLSVVTGSANGIELGQDSDASTDSARLFFSTSAGSNAIHSSSGSMRFFTGSTAGSSTGTERMRIDSSGNVGIGTSSPATKLDVYGNGLQIRLDGTANTSRGIMLRNTGTAEGQIQTDGNMHFIQEDAGKYMRFSTDNTERMRIDSLGNLLVGKTTTEPMGSATAGHTFYAGGTARHTVNAGEVMNINRLNSDGSIIGLYKSGTNVGSIGTIGTDIYIGTTDTGLRFLDSSNAIIPTRGDTGATRDNAIDFGTGSARFDDIYATNGTIQTSDFNEKQDIATLTATEMLVGKRLSGLFKTFRWKDSVASNPNARTHTGTIAQDVQAAFTAEGLDAGDYSLFISTTWFVDAEGNEVEEGTEGAVSKTRMGIRYPELLSFVAAYNEQRFASIEARLTALEG